jgi:DNA-binding PadR family transcriptional regulator
MRGHKGSQRSARAEGAWGDWIDPRMARRFAGPGGPGGRRRRRGDVRGEVLTALLDGPAHGYEVIRRLEEKSGGFWRPSAGSVYPTLQLLEDSGMVRASEQDGRRTYELTDEGRAEADEHASRAAEAADDPGLRSRMDVREAAVSLVKAAVQVGHVGNADQTERATAALRQARQTLYKILAED